MSGVDKASGVPAAQAALSSSTEPVPVSALRASIADGGSAFPVNSANLGGPGAYTADPGMTLRDWFAGQAIGAVVAVTSAGQHFPIGIGTLEEKMAQDAYRLADAMLTAREQTS